MITLPPLTKSPTRFSEEKRPSVGSTVTFSHALQLLQSEFVPKSKAFTKDEIFNGAKVKVVANSKNLVEVRFAGAKQTEFVSPAFLITDELTKAGRDLFKNLNGATTQTRKFLLGVTKA